MVNRGLHVFALLDCLIAARAHHCLPFSVCVVVVNLLLIIITNSLDFVTDNFSREMKYTAS